ACTMPESPPGIWPPARIRLFGSPAIRPACMASSEMLLAIMLRATASLGCGILVYGAATATGCPYGPTSPGTDGALTTPQRPGQLPPPIIPGPGASVETHPLSAVASTSHAFPVR